MLVWWRLMQHQGTYCVRRVECDRRTDRHNHIFCISTLKMHTDTNWATQTKIPAHKPDVPSECKLHRPRTGWSWGWRFPAARPSGASSSVCAPYHCPQTLPPGLTRPPSTQDHKTELYIQNHSTTSFIPHLQYRTDKVRDQPWHSPLEKRVWGKLTSTYVGISTWVEVNWPRLKTESQYSA